MPEVHREIGSVPESEIIRGGMEIHDQDYSGKEKIEVSAVDGNELLLEPKSLHSTESKNVIGSMDPKAIDRGEAAKALHKEGSGTYTIGEINKDELLVESEENDEDKLKPRVM